MLVLFSGYLGQGKCMWNSGENVIQSYYIADFTKDFFLTYFLFLCWWPVWTQDSWLIKNIQCDYLDACMSVLAAVYECLCDCDFIQDITEGANRVNCLA